MKWKKEEEKWVNDNIKVVKAFCDRHDGEHISDGDGAVCRFGDGRMLEFKPLTADAENLMGEIILKNKDREENVDFKLNLNDTCQQDGTWIDCSGSDDMESRHRFRFNGRYVSLYEEDEPAYFDPHNNINKSVTVRFEM